MDNMEVMAAAARRAMEEILSLKAEDRVLVVTDRQTRVCGDAYAAAAAACGCKVETFLLPEENRPLQTTPPEMMHLLEECDVVVNAIDGDSREVPFRIQWLTAVESRGTIRMGHSPGIDQDMMLNGPMNIDYGLMRERAHRLISALEDAVAVVITTDAGTDLHLDITDRAFVTDVDISASASANLPCGEIYCAPVETGADGVLVIDGCFGNHGPVSDPVTIRIKGGQVVDVEGENRHEVDIINGLLDTDKGARTIAELGIGVNPGARLTPRMLEAEKAFRTAHIAFGSNEGMPGGKSISSMHIDYLFHAPTITAVRADGRRQVVIDEGDFQI